MCGNSHRHVQMSERHEVVIRQGRSHHFRSERDSNVILATLIFL